MSAHTGCSEGVPAEVEGGGHPASVAIITKAGAEQGAGMASQARGPGAGSGAGTAVPVVWRLRTKLAFYFMEDGFEGHFFL